MSDLFTNDNSSVFRFSIQIFDFWKLNADIYFFSGIIRLQGIPMHIHLNCLGINRNYLFSDNFTCKAEQILKMTTIFTQNGPRLSFCENCVHFLNLLCFTRSSFFVSLRKITWLNSQQPKTRGHVEHLKPIV